MPGTIPNVDPPATRREHLIAALRERRWELGELRRELEMKVRDLEDELHHVERSVRARGQRLRIEGARCQDCGFELASRALHPPGRCPRCRSHHILGPWLRIA